MTEIEPEAVRLEFGPKTKVWLHWLLSDGKTDEPTLERAERIIAGYQANVQVQRDSITRLVDGDKADVEIARLAREIAVVRVQYGDLLTLCRSATSGNVDPATAIATLRTAIKGIVN